MPDHMAIDWLVLLQGVFVGVVVGGLAIASFLINRLVWRMQVLEQQVAHLTDGYVMLVTAKHDRMQAQGWPCKNLNDEVQPQNWTH